MELQKTIDTLQIFVSALSAQSYIHKVQGMVFKAQGFKHIGQKMMDHAAEEMEFSELFIDRMLTLGGEVKIELTQATPIEHDIIAYLQSDCQLSEGGIPQLRALAATVQDDYTTFDLLKQHLADEEKDLHWMHEQLNLIQQIGRERWLASQV